MGTEPAWWRRGPSGVLLAVGALLAVAAVVLGVLDARADARAGDRVAAVGAARSHLVDLGAAAADPAARSRAVDGATGAWRERLVGAAAGGATATVVRSVGLEGLEGDAARVLAVGLVSGDGGDGGDGGTRPFRAAVTLARVDDRWLVADVGELP